jgi:hypothetical protein
MGIKLRNRSKHFSAVLDSRLWSDPWEYGVKLEILREGADAWRDFLSQNGLADSPLLKSYIQQQWAISEKNQQGGRFKSKMTPTQVREAAAKAALESTDMDAANRKTLERLKPGLVAIGIVRVVECPSSHMLCTNAACGNRWEAEIGQLACPKCGDLAAIEDPENLAKPTGDAAADAKIQAELKERLLENITDAGGHVLLIDRKDEAGDDVPQGGNPVGDGMALAILIAMKEQEAFRADYQQEASDVLPHGSGGPSAAG